MRVSIACEIESERGAAIGNAKTDRDYSTVRDRAPGSTVEKRTSFQRETCQRGENLAFHQQKQIVKV